MKSLSLLPFTANKSQLRDDDDDKKKKKRSVRPSERASPVFVSKGIVAKNSRIRPARQTTLIFLTAAREGGDVAAAAFNVAVVVVDAEEEEEAFLIDFARGKELPSIVCAPRARFGASTMLRNGKCELRERGAI